MKGLYRWGLGLYVAIAPNCGYSGWYPYPIHTCDRAFNYDTCEPQGPYNVEDSCIQECLDWTALREEPYIHVYDNVKVTTYTSIEVSPCPDYGDYETEIGCSTGSQYIEYYSCVDGYYGQPKNANDSGACKACPANAKCSDGSIVCNRGYYRNGDTCVRCPASGGAYGTTARAGATAVTECYFAAGVTGTDITGSYTYTADCYY